MKSALIISGLPRSVDQGFPSMYNCLIAPNNPDVFIHTWGNPNDEGLRSKLESLFKPRLIKIESQKIIFNDYLNLDKMVEVHAAHYGRQKFVEMFHSMWYSLLQSNLLKEQFRLENNIKYDCVIRARFDLTYTKPINVSQYNLENTVWTATRPGLLPEMIDDRFAFSSNKNMNAYCSGFNLIEHIWSLREKGDGFFSPEIMCFEMAKIFNFKFQEIEGLAANHIIEKV